MSDTTMFEESAGLLENLDHASHDAVFRDNALRIAAAMYSFAVFGIFQSSIGVILQPLALQYSLSDLRVSLIFVAGPVGYVLAAQFSGLIHRAWGQRGIAVLAPTLHILGALAIASHPPAYSIILGAFTTIALGNGLLDGSWCAWAASMRNSNIMSGVLQGSFSIGAAAGSSLSGAVLLAWGVEWYSWFHVLVAASVVELCVLGFAFRHESASKYRHQKGTKEHNKTRPLSAVFKYPALWLTGIYFLAYVGIETTISGWIIPFMIRYRNATPHLASLSSTGFWGGMAIGRFALGVLTDKVGVSRANILYFLIAIFFQICFAGCHGSILSILFVTLIGFFMGPMFASGIVILTRQLPSKMHVSAVSIVASAGQLGAAMLPFALGTCIQVLGIGTFPLALVVLTLFTLVSWITLSR